MEINVWTRKDEFSTVCWKQIDELQFQFAEIHAPEDFVSEYGNDPEYYRVVVGTVNLRDCTVAELEEYCRPSYGDENPLGWIVRNREPDAIFLAIAESVFSHQSADKFTYDIRCGTFAEALATLEKIVKGDDSP